MMVAGLQGVRGFFGQRGLLAGLIMIVNTYSWNFPLYILFESKVLLEFVNGDDFVFAYVIAAYYLTSVLSAFAGVFLVSRYQIRDKILVSWMLSGVLSSVLLVFLPNASLAGNYPYLYFVLLLLGFSLGFGFPSSLSYFSDYNVENKGTQAGMVFLASGFGILIMGFLSTTPLPFEILVLIFALWRGIGCVLFLLLRPKREEEAESPYLNVTYNYVLGERRFVLYFLPWIIYTVVNYFAVVVLQDLFLKELEQQFIESMLIAEFAIGGIVALVAGILSDRVGRKPVIASGFVALGIGYALLGLFSTGAAYVYVLVDGISFGIFAMAFFLLLWGELAIDKSKEKYYLLGELPFLVFSYLGILIKPYVSARLWQPPTSTAFSLAAFFLFLAILPLMYAPETLPQTKIRERELKSYIEKAKKAKEKRT